LLKNSSDCSKEFKTAETELKEKGKYVTARLITKYALEIGSKFPETHNFRG